MGKYLNFENEEKGYEKFDLTKENVRANIGKTICYVDFVDRHRGTYFVRYATIHSIRYSTILLDDGDRKVDVRDILECGIKI